MVFNKEYWFIGRDDEGKTWGDIQGKRTNGGNGSVMSEHHDIYSYMLVNFDNMLHIS